MCLIWTARLRRQVASRVVCCAKPTSASSKLRSCFGGGSHAHASGPTFKVHDRMPPSSSNQRSRPPLSIDVWMDGRARRSIDRGGPSLIKRSASLGSAVVAPRDPEPGHFTSGTKAQQELIRDDGSWGQVRGPSRVGPAGPLVGIASAHRFVVQVDRPSAPARPGPRTRSFEALAARVAAAYHARTVDHKIPWTRASAHGVERDQ